MPSRLVCGVCWSTPSLLHDVLRNKSLVPQFALKWKNSGRRFASCIGERRWRALSSVRTSIIVSIHRQMSHLWHCQDLKHRRSTDVQSQLSLTCSWKYLPQIFYVRVLESIDRACIRTSSSFTENLREEGNAKGFPFLHKTADLQNSRQQRQRSTSTRVEPWSKLDDHHTMNHFSARGAEKWACHTQRADPEVTMTWI